MPSTKMMSAKNSGFTLVEPKRSVVPAKAGIHSRKAFTLVELSIVLVILGLLVGGVLTGQSLIRAAELRSVVTQYNGYVTAVNSFKDKYFALPGDMNNAQSFWATATNGNGDGNIDYPSAPSVAGEIFGLWQQLALAGMIEGSYTGIAGSGGSGHTILGTNAPKSKLSGGGWSAYYFPTVGYSNASWGNFEGNYGNTFVFGAAATNGMTESPLIKAEEAWNIDTKADDGRPGLGRIRSYEVYTNCQDAGQSNVAPLAAVANYKLSDTSNSCILLFDMK